VLIRKGFRYRVYPSAEQIANLNAWEDALRFLWNLANEQRLIAYGHCKCDRRYPTAFDQINELTELRSELLWLSDVPRNVCAQLLVELDKAWQRCFKHLADAPQWKRKNVSVIGMCEPHPKVWKLEGEHLHFPKLGSLRVVLHRPLAGKPKTCTLRRDGDQWFASIVCEIDVAVPTPRTEPVIAIDRGITNLIADSDGHKVPNPYHLEKTLKRLKRAQRIASNRKKGSNNRKKAVIRANRLHRKVKRQREHVLHGLSARYSKSHGTVVVEQLNIQGMIKNHHLARRIAGAGWGIFGQMLRYKLAWNGGQLIELPANYSSQTCSSCGHVDSNSRHEEKFVCTKCGYVDHADVNAAKVLKQRYYTPGKPWCLPVEGLLPEGTRRDRKLKVKLRVPRHLPLESTSL
jgi:putative transposase